MAKNRKPKKKKSASTLTSLWVSLTSILSLIGGTGVSGWVNPDLPVIGQIVASVTSPPDESSPAPSTGPPSGMPGMQPVPQPPAPGSRPPLASISSTPAMPPPPPPAAPVPSSKPSDAVLIASFNIQVFGESKLAKREVVDVLARVVRMFDVVAVQEVRAKSDDVVPTFVKAVNADGSRYHWVIGPRLGRTVSKEQYTFIYDTTRIELDPSSPGTIADPGGRLHRPPMYARFRTRAYPPEAAFTFWMVDTHTDPDEVPQEVDALADVFEVMQRARPDEDDVILLGDLNAAPNQLGRIARIPNIGWAVSGTTTNTRRTKTYDNIIFARAATAEYTGRWGVLDLQSTFGLSLDQALQVSDHNPVWAAFSPWEARRTQ
ncbi:MAG: endonuclease/exonuclease/phosphatase family protein [Planctomycetia bacterium]